MPLGDFEDDIHPNRPSDWFDESLSSNSTWDRQVIGARRHAAAAAAADWAEHSTEQSSLLLLGSSNATWDLDVSARQTIDSLAEEIYQVHSEDKLVLRELGIRLLQMSEIVNAAVTVCLTVVCCLTMLFAGVTHARLCSLRWIHPLFALLSTASTRLGNMS